MSLAESSRGMVVVVMVCLGRSVKRYAAKMAANASLNFPPFGNSSPSFGF
jgi:hypothetical protein